MREAESSFNESEADDFPLLMSQLETSSCLGTGLFSGSKDCCRMALDPGVPYGQLPL